MSKPPGGCPASSAAGGEVALGSRFVLSGIAQRRALREFGEDAALRYGALLAQAFSDIGADPERPGSLQRPELALPVESKFRVICQAGLNMLHLQCLAEVAAQRISSSVMRGAGRGAGGIYLFHRLI